MQYPLNVIFVFSLLLTFLSTHGGQLVVGAVDATESVQNRWVSETHWPSRGRTYRLFWIPAKTGSFTRHDELAYFVALVRVLDEGVSNRMNMDGVLRTSRTPTQYERLYELYRERQGGVVSRL